MNTIQLLLPVLLVLSALSTVLAVAEVVTARQLRTDLTRMQARHNREVLP